MQRQSRQSLVTVAGPLLLTGFALALLAAAVAAYAAGLAGEAADSVPRTSAASNALLIARGALFISIGGLIASLLLFVWFVERRVANPLRRLTRACQSPASLTAHAGSSPAPFRALAAAIDDLRLRADEGRVAPHGSYQELKSFLASLEQSHQAAIGRMSQSASGADEAARVLGAVSARLAAEADLLAGSSARISTDVTGAVRDLGSATQTMRLLADETRAHGAALKATLQPIGPGFAAVLETLHAAAGLLQRQAAHAGEQIDALVATGKAGTVHAESAARELAGSSTALRTHAADLAETARRVGGRLAAAAEDFRRAGQVLATEASSVRGVLSDGAGGISSARTHLEALIARLSGGDGIVLPEHTAPHPVHAEDLSVIPPAALSFARASEEVLSLAQAIERLETRTTELAARLETDDDTVAADDADTRTDEAIAALMGSIERINTIAAAISQAGDAALKRSSGERAFH